MTSVLQTPCFEPLAYLPITVYNVYHSMDFVSRRPFTACVGPEGIEPTRINAILQTDELTTCSITPNRTEKYIGFKLKV